MAARRARRNCGQWLKEISLRGASEIVVRAGKPEAAWVARAQLALLLLLREGEMGDAADPQTT